MTKSRSRRRWLSAGGAGALLLASIAPGCIVVGDGRHHDDDWYYDDHGDDGDERLDDAPATVSIDEGASVGAVEPGVGAGIFVEVGSDGLWRVQTACDTLSSGYACDFQLFLEASGILLEGETDLEGDDDLDEYDGELDLYFLTESDFDGVTFSTDAGAAVTLTAYLDGASQPEFVYWVGDGIQNEGAPTNPVTFVIAR